MKKKGILSFLLMICILVNGISVSAEGNQEGNTVVTESVKDKETESEMNHEGISDDLSLDKAENKNTLTLKRESIGASINTEPQKQQKLGETVQIKANVSGSTEELSYKFVWMKDNWKQWGILQDFSPENITQFTPKETGTYRIYADVKDQQGNVYTTFIDYAIVTDFWEFNDVTVNLKSPQEKYEGPIEISAVTAGEISRLKYKFVWAKTDWSKWGVLHDFSSESSAMWMPKEIGTYWIYVDVKDADGQVLTKRIPYVIIPLKWDLDRIALSSDVVKKGEDVSVSASVSGNTKELRYKYVWMKDNWKEWGVIQDLSEKQDAVWKTPKKAGKYKIYADVIDRDGMKITKEKECTVLSQIWKQEAIEINSGGAGCIYTELPVTAKVSGETEGLSYKYVWMKDNWKEWGVIKEFDRNNTGVWYPKKAGTYQIYSDVKDEDGQVQTLTKEYVVQDAPWKVENLDVDGSGSYYVGDKTTVTARVTGETDGLKFKFVQRNGNDWSDWKILKDFDSDNSVEVTIEKEGITTIYVDVMDQRGVVFEPQTLTLTGNTLLSVKASEAKIALGKSVTFSPRFSGTVSGGEYKYVWMKDNWKEWGVIQDFSAKSQVTWTPEGLGQYHIYIDARLHGITQSKSIAVEVSREKNGWYYENGYKIYYRDGKKLEDVRGIIGGQTAYEIKINKQMSCVTVYAKDGNNGYIIPVVAFACSPGSATPTGTFYTQEKYRWHHLYGADGQFCTRITGHVLFHSPPYSSFNNHTLWPKEYNKLGTWASSGCVRLRSGDAKWIYDNCSSGTKVTIYNSSTVGPFSKPVYSKIPLSQTWDPTDPYA